MDDSRLGTVLRYVALNPVRARLTQRAADWRWTSLPALLAPGPGDGLSTTGPVLSRYPNFVGLIAAGEDETMSLNLRRASTIGRPVGAKDVPAWLESEAGPTLSLGKRGWKAQISAL